MSPVQRKILKPKNRASFFPRIDSKNTPCLKGGVYIPVLNRSFFGVCIPEISEFSLKEQHIPRNSAFRPFLGR